MKEKKHKMGQIRLDNGKLWNPLKLIENGQGSATTTENCKPGDNETYVAIYETIQAEIITPSKNDEAEETTRCDKDQLTILKCKTEANRKQWTRHAKIKGNEEIQLLKQTTEKYLPETTLLDKLINGEQQNKKELTKKEAIQEAIAIALHNQE